MFAIEFHAVLLLHPCAEAPERDTLRAALESTILEAQCKLRMEIMDKTQVKHFVF